MLKIITVDLQQKLIFYRENVEKHDYNTKYNNKINYILRWRYRVTAESLIPAVTRSAF